MEEWTMNKIKEVANYRSGGGGMKRYFDIETEKGKVLVSIREWASDPHRTLEEVLSIFETAEFSSYDTGIDYEYPLSIYSLTSFKFRNEISSNNMSLWEYETLIKGNTVHPALKCAFIQKDENSEEVSVICESYDIDSHTTKENLQIVYKHWNSVKREIMQLLNKKSEYIESFNY